MSSAQLKRLSHVCMGTPDLERALGFYCDVLGAKVIHEYRNDKGRYGAFLTVNNGTFLEFFNEPTPQPEGGHFRHLCFEVDDVNATAAHLSGQGFAAEVKRGRTDHVLQCWIKDPDGNMVEFHQYDAQAVQFPYKARP